MNPDPSNPAGPVAAGEALQRFVEFWSDGHPCAAAELKVQLDDLLDLHVRTALAQAAAATVEVPGWISVQTRCPEAGADVLVWSERRGEVEAAYYQPWKATDEMWEINGTFYPLAEVTHWMEAPAAPSHPDSAERT